MSLGPRHRAREVALRVLFQLESQPGDWRSPLAYHLAEAELSPASGKFAGELVEGVLSHREQIDATLAACSSHWKLDQMGGLERAVLRLATEELGWRHTDPVAVVIDEAVILAKQMGGENAGRFVNGLLGKVAQTTAA